MQVLGLFFDGVLVAHYERYVDMERDIYHLKKNLGSKAPAITYKNLFFGFTEKP